MFVYLCVCVLYFIERDAEPKRWDEIENVYRKCSRHNVDQVCFSIGLYYLNSKAKRPFAKFSVLRYVLSKYLRRLFQSLLLFATIRIVVALIFHVVVCDVLREFLAVHLKISSPNSCIVCAFLLFLFLMAIEWCSFAKFFLFFLHRWCRCSLTPVSSILWAWKSIWNVCLSSGTLIGLCFQNSPKRHIYALSKIIINIFCTFIRRAKPIFRWRGVDECRLEMKCHSVEANAWECRTQNIYQKSFQQRNMNFAN